MAGVGGPGKEADVSGEDVRQAFLGVELGPDRRRNTTLCWGFLLVNEQVGTSQNEDLVALRRETGTLYYRKTSM